MTDFTFCPPKLFNRSVYNCHTPSENYRLKTLLILLGLGTIKQSHLHKNIKLTKTFISIPYQNVGKPKISNIVNKFDGATRYVIDRFFVNSITMNSRLQKNIYTEIVKAIGHLETKNNLACFLYTYRIIEQIALCLPIISIIEKGSFDNKFLDYQQLINLQAKSDLSVLKKYSENVLDSSIRNSTVVMDFSHTTSPSQNVEVIKKVIKDTTLLVNASVDSIEMKYKYMDRVIIGFRNKYFHFLYFDDNFSNDEIGYPEEFLEVCNPIFINYFSFLFLDLLRSEYYIWG